MAISFDNVYNPPLAEPVMLKVDTHYIMNGLFYQFLLCYGVF